MGRGIFKIQKSTNFLAKNEQDRFKSSHKILLQKKNEKVVSLTKRQKY